MRSWTFSMAAMAVEMVSAPVVPVGTAPAVRIVHQSLPVTNVKELIALAARRAGELN